MGIFALDPFTTLPITSHFNKLCYASCVTIDLTIDHAVDLAANLAADLPKGKEGSTEIMLQNS